MLSIFKTVQFFFIAGTEEPDVENGCSPSDTYLEHFLEDLSPFYSEKSIEDMGIIELFSRIKKRGDY